MDKSINSIGCAPVYPWIKGEVLNYEYTKLREGNYDIFNGLLTIPGVDQYSTANLCVFCLTQIYDNSESLYYNKLQDVNLDNEPDFGKEDEDIMDRVICCKCKNEIEFNNPGFKFSSNVCREMFELETYSNEF